MDVQTMQLMEWVHEFLVEILRRMEVRGWHHLNDGLEYTLYTEAREILHLFEKRQPAWKDCTTS